MFNLINRRYYIVCLFYSFFFFGTKSLKSCVCSHLPHTQNSHLSSVQQLHVASGYGTGQDRSRMGSKDMAWELKAVLLPPCHLSIQAFPVLQVPARVLFLPAIHLAQITHHLVWLWIFLWRTSISPSQLQAPAGQEPHVIFLFIPQST